MDYNYYLTYRKFSQLNHNNIVTLLTVLFFLEYTEDESLEIISAVNNGRNFVMKH